MARAGGVRFGFVLSEYTPPSEGLRLGVMAEQLGFDSIWMHDEIVLADLPNPSEQWTTLSALGAITKRVTVGTAVADCLRIHPSKLAQMTASMDDLTNGRAVLGLGAGEALNIVPYGIGWKKADERAEMMREGIEVIKLLFSRGKSGGANFQGKYFSLNNAGMLTQFITRPHPPIFVGALGSRRMLEITGELGDGWLPWVTSPSVWERRLGVIEAAARGVGRKLNSIECCAFLTPYVGEDPDMLNAVKKTLKFNLIGERYTLKEMGVSAPTPKRYNIQDSLFNSEDVEAMMSVTDHVSDSFLEKNKILAAGKPDDVIEVIERYVEAGSTHIVIAEQSRSRERTVPLMKAIGNSVIPYFKNSSARR